MKDLLDGKITMEQLEEHDRAIGKQKAEELKKESLITQLQSIDLKDKKKEVDEQTFQTLNSLQALLVYEPVSLLISYEQLTKMAGFDVRDTNGVVYRGQYNS